MGHGGARGEPRKKATSPSSWPQMTTGMGEDGLLELGKDILDEAQLQVVHRVFKNCSFYMRKALEQKEVQQ